MMNRTQILLKDHLLKGLPLLALCILLVTSFWLWWEFYRNLQIVTERIETVTFIVAICFCIITSILLLTVSYLFWNARNKSIHLSGQSNNSHNNSEDSTLVAAGANLTSDWQWDILSGKLIINRHLVMLTGFTIENNTQLNFDSWLALMSIEDLQQFNESLEHYVKPENFKTNSDIRLMNSGKITIDSTDGLKFEFGFTIRLSRKLKIGKNVLKKESPPKIIIPDIFVGNTARILVLTNNIVNILVTQGLLNKLGLRSDVATGKAEAHTALATTSYDLVFMDTQVQLTDCIELTSIIRDQNSTVLDHNIPVIAMTSNAMTYDNKMLTDAGMNGCITKPLSYKDLLAILSLHLTLPKKADRSKVMKELNRSEIHLFEAFARSITQPNKSDRGKNTSEYRNWLNSRDVVDSDPTSRNRTVLLKCLYDDENVLEQDISYLAEVPEQLHVLQDSLDPVSAADRHTRQQNLNTSNKTTNMELLYCAAELEVEVNKLQDMMTDTKAQYNETQNNA